MPSENRRNVIVGDKTWENLRSLAKKEKRSISDIVREACLELLKRREKGQVGYDPVSDRFRRPGN